MPNKEFLEDYSLFRRLKIEVPETMNLLDKPAINMECLKCESIQTFKMEKDYNNYHPVYTADRKQSIVYTCQSCRDFTRQFQVYFSPDNDYMYKFGQYPEWEIKMDKGLEKTLGKHSKTFRKGLVCESQGYGIAAFAYYRRITEEIIDELLESITDLIDEENRDKYITALEETKKTRVTQDKINLVKDLVPSILKPNGINPLGILHSELSKGLHSESDAICLENANHIKNILTFLINQIMKSKESAKDFTQSMKSILAKKADK